MERSASSPALKTLVHSRTGRALRTGANWWQLAKFSLVGGSGVLVNLAVYTTLVRGLDVHFRAAAVCSFLVAVTNNYTWNRLWTFRRRRGHIAYQGLRFLIVSLLALALNVALLSLLVALGVDEILAQLLAIAFVTPVNFVGNRLWSFRLKRPAT